MSLRLRKSQILCHRGLWGNASDQNNARALREALEKGYGLETDLRDQSGNIVISHDPAEGRCTPVKTLLKDFKSSNAPIAFNIKCDGIGKMCEHLLAGIQNYFYFDMSGPELLKYAGFVSPRHLCTRISDFEKPLLLEKSGLVWVDEMRRAWVKRSDIASLVRLKKKVFVVSPELHRRPHENRWRIYREWMRKGLEFGLCTDLPREAETYFNA